MSESRTVNTVKNATAGAIVQIISILLNFVVRTVFIHILGKEYLGINGLFSNILLVLSFAELGIGNAIIFNLYKPLAEGNQEKIKSLIRLYKKAYQIIGIIVFVAGLILIPFLGLIIKEEPDIVEDIKLLFFLFLANTTASYFFVYKKSLIIADQRNYIVIICTELFNILKISIQILLLWLTRNYIIFLVIQIVFTLATDIFFSFKVNKEYPYLVDKHISDLDSSEKKDIFRNVSAMAIYKFGSVILNGTGNIIISIMFGIVAVGINSNYMLIITALTAIFGQILNGFTSSLGNLNAIGSLEIKRKTFYKTFFISSWIYGFVSLGLLLFLNPFIGLWLGGDFLFDKLTVLAIVIHVYVNGMQFATYTYRVTMGLFTKGKIAPLIAAILNITLSIILGKLIGISGIFFAASISRLLTTGLWDPILVFRYGLMLKPKSYYLRYFLFTLLFFIIYLVFWLILGFIPLKGVLSFVVNLIIFIIGFNAMLLAIFWKSNSFQEIKNSTALLLKKIGKRKNIH